jgi:hypothetical protein
MTNTCNDGKEAVAGGKALGAGPIEKNDPIQPGLSELRPDIGFICVS